MTAPLQVLAGDIGGTHARLALVETGNRLRVLAEASYPSQDAPGLAPLVERFLAGKTPRPTRACFAVAGPVVGGEARATNLAWVVNAAALSGQLGIRHLRLINDFEAAGYGVLQLDGPDLATLQQGIAVDRGPIAVIGAGTGLGEGFLFWEVDRYRAHPSEGGHVSFAAETPRQATLGAFLAQRYGRVSYERVLSGPGLASVYEFVSGRVEDPAAISERGLAGTDPHAVEALDLFAAVYGAQAGNLALTVLATGGVYLCGGIAPRLIAKLGDGTFINAFNGKGRLAPVMARMPVRVVMSPDVGLLGAAAVAASM